jgi:hypothetical protein
MTSHGRRLGSLLGALAVIVVLTATGLDAHLMTYRGTVAKVEGSRIQVKTVDDQGKDIPEPQWFTPDEKTKITRGETRVTFAEAKITAGERIVVIVDHRSDDDVPVVEVRLGAK